MKVYTKLFQKLGSIGAEKSVTEIFIGGKEKLTNGLISNMWLFSFFFFFFFFFLLHNKLSLLEGEHTI